MNSLLKLKESFFSSPARRGFIVVRVALVFSLGLLYSGKALCEEPDPAARTRDSESLEHILLKVAENAANEDWHFGDNTFKDGDAKPAIKCIHNNLLDFFQKGSVPPEIRKTVISRLSRAGLSSGEYGKEFWQILQQYFLSTDDQLFASYTNLANSVQKCTESQSPASYETGGQRLKWKYKRYDENNRFAEEVGIGPNEQVLFFPGNIECRITPVFIEEKTSKQYTISRSLKCTSSLVKVQGGDRVTKCSASGRSAMGDSKFYGIKNKETGRNIASLELICTLK